MGKLSKDRRDIYYRKAKENGYRARSSFKLIQINEKFGIFKLFDPEKYEKKDKDKIGDIYNENFCYNIVDLCAAPGSWSQVLKNICLYNYYQMLHWVNTNEGTSPNCDEHERFLNDFSLYINFNDELEKRIENLHKKKFVKKPKIIAVDLQEIGNMKYVQIIQGDITKASTVDQILRCMKEGEVGNDMGDDTRGDVTYGDDTFQGSTQPKRNTQLGGQNSERNNFPTYAHAVVSDGAPDITGMNDIDEFIQSQLILSSLKVCCSVLKIGGNFISKIFRGEHTGLLILHLNKFFERVYVCKPQSSRNKSLESFLVCLNFSLPRSNITAMSHHTEEKKVNRQSMHEEELRKMHAKLITEKDNEGEICRKGKSLGRDEKRDDTIINGQEFCAEGEDPADTSEDDNNVESEGHKEGDGKGENEFAHINECTSDDAEAGNVLKGDKRMDCDPERGDTLMGTKFRRKNFTHKNVDIFNFYCSDSDEEIKYFNSDDEEIVNEYIASEVFMNDKLFSFVATQNYYDSDKSYLLPQNYKKRQEGKKP
ncbi:ribosomal RNA methyltransferase [Plasmodium cynomolgi strain B]|uniref:Putative tRNA (cytidine(32)/guanosine(34)-2'-O)-methyltransferase n=1 Tax=Plasmodium cynomolgi (strain B) TaxID=1120755 RepID=K6V932_PLACD|nr:ribosomal RNA methyltransferase [Plasmodium cynomolgi strain B]GAB65662.1 ribosomal RNA methyltransferase [Plasmodium cynomolgi strain B]